MAKILVIEASASRRELLSSLLEAEKHQVVFAGSEEETARALRVFAPDGVVLRRDDRLDAERLRQMVQLHSASLPFRVIADYAWGLMEERREGLPLGKFLGRLLDGLGDMFAAARPEAPPAGGRGAAVDRLVEILGLEEQAATRVSLAARLLDFGRALPGAGQEEGRAWGLPRAYAELVGQAGADLGLAAIFNPPAGQSAGGVEAAVLRVLDRLDAARGAAGDDEQSLIAALRQGDASGADALATEAAVRLVISERRGVPEIPIGAPVVVVDPDPAVGQAFRLRLENERMVGRAFADGKRASGFIASQAPSLVISALAAPGLDGLGLLLALKKKPETRSVPVLLAAKRPSPGQQARAKQMGAAGFLEQPLKLETVMARVKELLAGGRARPAAGSGGAQGAAAPAATPGTPLGDLTSVSVPDMILMLAEGGKSGRLGVTNESAEASLFLQDGQLVHAVLGAQAGEEAFFAVAREWPAGEYTFYDGVKPATRSIEAPLAELVGRAKKE